MEEIEPQEELRKVSLEKLREAVAQWRAQGYPPLKELPRNY